jgi:integrase
MGFWGAPTVRPRKRRSLGLRMASKPFFNAKRREWYIKYKPDPIGDWKRAKLGKHIGPVKEGVTPRVPDKIEVKAREFAELEYRAKHGLIQPRSKSMPLREYLDGYVAARAIVVTPKTTAHIRRGVDRFVKFAASRSIVSIQGVTRGTCRDYLESRAARLAPSTLRTERGYLMGAWTRAVDDDLIAVNPWLKAKAQGKVTPTTITFWSIEEVGRIAAACSQPWQSDFILFLANTGLRVQTGLAVRWAWFDAGDNSLGIEPGPNIKTVYRITLSKVAREILERRRVGATSPLVFPRPEGDRPICYTTIRDALARAIGRAGVKVGTPHDLRHSYGRALALLGVPATVIQKQMGHTTLNMTMRYMVTDQSHVARFIEDLDLGSVSPGTPPHPANPPSGDDG